MMDNEKGLFPNLSEDEMREMPPPPKWERRPSGNASEEQLADTLWTEFYGRDRWLRLAEAQARLNASNEADESGEKGTGK